MQLRNKKVLVVGLGKSGLAVCRFLLEQGAQVAATDMRRDVGAGTAPLPGIECHLGGHPPEIFTGRDLIVVSPGVPWGEGLQEARQRKIPILGELELAFRFLQAPVIAVTGTNGKSTVVTLIGALLRAGGKQVEVAGNIGKPLIEVVMEAKKLDWVVTEVSSYQLETVDHFHARVAVLLNVTPDHLDRYPDMEAYAAAKYRIFNRQTGRDLAIYNQDDPWAVRGVQSVKAKKVGFSSRCAGDDRFSHPHLPGRHNLENILASVAAAEFCGVSPESIQKTLEGFRGLPHRIEFVRERQGVRYFDDSKGTNIDAVIRALEDFSDHSVLLIAGGKHKGASYEPLRSVIQRKVKHLLLIGEASRQMAAELTGATKISEPLELHKAVAMAAQEAQAGDVVLLSPACSSFDQFKDYKERGDLFQKLVRAL